MAEDNTKCVFVEGQECGSVNCRPEKKGRPRKRPPFTNVGCEELELKLQVQLEDATVNNRAGKVAIGAVRHGNRLEQLSKRTW